MKRLILAATLLATPALAQTAPPGAKPVPQAPTVQQQLDTLPVQVTQGELVSMREGLIQFQAENATLRQQLDAANARDADLQKQLDAAKKAPEPAAKP